MISQLIFSKIESLITLLLFPHILPYSAASVDGRFGGRSIVINSHHIAPTVSEINSRVGLGYASYFAARSPCDAQVLVVVFYQVAYGVVFVSASRGFMF